MKKKNLRPNTPAQVEARSRPSQAEFTAAFDPASDIVRQLLEAEERQAAASEARRLALFPPLTNRGGKSGNGDDGLVSLVLENGKVKQVMKRVPVCPTAAVVDWVNLTIGRETFDEDDCSRADGEQMSADSEKVVPLVYEDYIVCCSRTIKGIFGFGISHRNQGGGQNFYEETWSLPESWGSVSIGGQRDTILITLSGTGLAAAREGWEQRLKDFLETASRSRITRVDLAFDDYDGRHYSVDRADQEHTDGLFNCGGRNPRCEYRGDWKNPDGKGRTFYVGNRKNGKFCRVYEKGRELGSPSSEWVRIEVEFKSVDRIIPFDILTRPGQYLAASYPAFEWISHHRERIETTKKVVEASVEKAVKWLKHQCGTHIHYLVQLFGQDELIQKITRYDKLPAFMKVPHFGHANKSIHEVSKSPLPFELTAAAYAW